MADSIQGAIVAKLKADATFMALVVGGVYPYQIARNVAKEGTSKTPGSTPDAFDAATTPGSLSRVRISCAVFGGTDTEDPLGPKGAWFTFPRLMFWCQPKESEKAKVRQAINRAKVVLELKPLATDTRPFGLRFVGGRDFLDDPGVAGAVYREIRMQTDGIW